MLVYMVHQKTYALGNFFTRMIFPFSKLNLKVGELPMQIKNSRHSEIMPTLLIST